MWRKSSNGRRWTSRQICPSRTRSALILWPQAKLRVSAIACMSLWTPRSTIKNTENQMFSKSWSFARQFTRGTIGTRQASLIERRKSKSSCPKIVRPIRRESSYATSPRSRRLLKIQMGRSQSNSNSEARRQSRAERRSANQRGSDMLLHLMRMTPRVSPAARWFPSQRKTMTPVTA